MSHWDRQATRLPLEVAAHMTATPYVTSEEASLDVVMAEMEKHDVRHLPVVKGDRLVGIVSDRHLRDALPSILMLNDPIARRRALAASRVRDVMVRNPITVQPDTPIIEAIRRMRAFRGGSVPVVDHGRLVGILTAGDLISLLERMLAA
ncbi:MAG: CBS domain-containing protein [Myxococcales bacterium]|nr:CBS domain-containing protein [Myxococcales bacterium]